MNNIYTTMCKILYSIYFFISFFFITSLHAQVQTPRNISMTSNSKGFYEYLPAGYSSGTQTYPLIIFLHGVGELGKGFSELPKVLNTGLPALIQQGKFPNSFTTPASGTQSFIVISPQFVNWPAPKDINNILDYVIKNYRVNTNRVYVTGLSMGGGGTWDFACSPNYVKRTAAIVPIAGASTPNKPGEKQIADNGLAVWATHNDHDPTVPVSYTIDYIAGILARNPSAPVKKTIFSSTSHDAWTKTYDPAFKENGMNVYEWMLQYQRGTTTPPINQLPKANAGVDISITLPVNSVQLNGNNSSDPDGTIKTYSWTKISGPSQFTISNTGIVNPVFSNLAAGVYTLRLTVTDNNGATATDDIVITVNAAVSVNQSPKSNAGVDISITLPVNSVQLNGNNSSDPDGTIKTYSWTKISGPSQFTISNTGIVNPVFSNLAAGVYTLRLTVTDNNGATGTDEININVNDVTTEVTSEYALIYPNPVIDVFTLKLINSYRGKINIQIIDLTGSVKEVMNAFKDQDKLIQRFNSGSGLMRGSYFVRIAMGAQSITLKIVKM
jgi:dienelactone hydrolase